MSEIVSENHMSEKMSEMTPSKLMCWFGDEILHHVVELFEVTKVKVVFAVR